MIKMVDLRPQHFASNGGNFCSGGNMGACAMRPRIIGQGRAAAHGFARRTLDQSLKRVKARQIQRAALFEMQMVQGHSAEMAMNIARQTMGEFGQ